MTKRQQTAPTRSVLSIESEMLVLDKESLKDLEPAADQQGALRVGRATVRDCIM